MTDVLLIRAAAVWRGCELAARGLERADGGNRAAEEDFDSLQWNSLGLGYEERYENDRGRKESCVEPEEAERDENP